MLEHPGGKRVIMMLATLLRCCVVVGCGLLGVTRTGRYAGKDASEEFNMMHKVMRLTRVCVLLPPHAIHPSTPPRPMLSPSTRLKLCWAASRSLQSFEFCSLNRLVVFSRSCSFAFGCCHGHVIVCGVPSLPSNMF